MRLGLALAVAGGLIQPARTDLAQQQAGSCGYTAFANFRVPDNNNAAGNLLPGWEKHAENGQTTVSVAACKSLCEKRVGCRAFMWSTRDHPEVFSKKHMCFQYSGVSSGWGTAYGHMIPETGTTVGVFPDCTQNAGQFCDGNPLGGDDGKPPPFLANHMANSPSLEDCAARCSVTQGCEVYSWSTWDVYRREVAEGGGMCYLKPSGTCTSAPSAGGPVYDSCDFWHPSPPVPANMSCGWGVTGQTCDETFGARTKPCVGVVGDVRTDECTVQCEEGYERPLGTRGKAVRYECEFDPAQAKGKWKQLTGAGTDPSCTENATCPAGKPGLSHPSTTGSGLPSYDPVGHAVSCRGAEALSGTTCALSCARTSLEPGTAGYRLAGANNGPSSAHPFLCRNTAEGYHWIRNSTDSFYQCMPMCEDGWGVLYGNGNKCKRCPPGQVSNSTEHGLECKQCTRSVNNSAQSKCELCDGPGVGPNKAGTECVPCEGNQYSAEGSDLCIECSEETNGPIDNHTTCNYPTWMITICAVAGALFLGCCGCVCWYRYKYQTGAGPKSYDILRQSLLGTHNMPGIRLAEEGVAGRWAVAQQQRRVSESDPTLLKDGSGRVAKDSTEGVAYEMFTNDHLSEVKPKRWRDQMVGKGSFGKVYRATWRGAEVAIKEITFPEDLSAISGSSEAAREGLKNRLLEITADFVAEVEICCDLSHPNLVRLMGFATQPTLLIMQELLRGDSLDKQLYIAGWKPDHGQTRKIAMDVAQGMAYLHTSFLDSDHYDRPIIHRDLKSPNLVLAAPPPQEGEEGEVLVKITDFGLSKDKSMNTAKHTTMMTGCGSVLWMAPEILLGEAYNEKVDLFAFAMTMVEVIDGHLPWTAIAPPEAVALRVTNGDVPDRQLRKALAPMRELVRRCWRHSPEQRPSFPEVVEMLQQMEAGDIGGRE